MDGSGYFHTMVKVIMPMAKPSIITVILFNFLSFWNEYIIAMTLTSGDFQTLPVGLMNLMKAQNASRAVWADVRWAGHRHAADPHPVYRGAAPADPGMTVGGIKG